LFNENFGSKNLSLLGLDPPSWEELRCWPVRWVA
jgi:hypothetical protein